MKSRDDFQKRLGYSFKNEVLLESALTHASAGGEADYQRLEFLGDRVLGLIVAECLYELFPNEPEGGLSKRHTALVRGETLAKAARSIDIGKAMVISDSEESGGGRVNTNILSDIMEAVIGAVYLDGGLDAARKILAPLLADEISALATPPRDPKTTLQEWSQAQGMGLPDYALIARDGPDHAPDFTVTVTINGKTATAKGASKRAAEKAAAQTLIDELGI
ncbi:MAG: ribonuclease III [Proteobacteria bacterium]|nr:ribonuclease III [Pseudomonadota bacterium]